MLNRRRVKYHIGRVFPNHRHDPVPVPDRADADPQVDLGSVHAYFLLNVVGVVFVAVKYHDLFRTVFRKLSYQLAAYGASAPCHQGCFARKPLIYLIVVNQYLISLEELLHGNIPYLFHTYPVVYQTGDSRQGSQPAAQAFAYLQYFILAVPVYCGDGNDYLLYSVLMHKPGNGVAISLHNYSFYRSASFFGIVVNETAYNMTSGTLHKNLSGKVSSRLPGSYNQGFLQKIVSIVAFNHMGYPSKASVGESYSPGEGTLEHSSEEEI